ncbi:MAG: hypothetical protein AB7O73_10305 [Bacteroidia bacterium]
MKRLIIGVLLSQLLIFCGGYNQLSANSGKNRGQTLSLDKTILSPGSCTLVKVDELVFIKTPLNHTNNTGPQFLFEIQEEEDSFEDDCNDEVETKKFNKNKLTKRTLFIYSILSPEDFTSCLNQQFISDSGLAKNDSELNNQESLFLLLETFRI